MKLHRTWWKGRRLSGDYGFRICDSKSLNRSLISSRAIFHAMKGRKATVKIEPGNAAVLIVRRDKGEKSRYVFSVRTCSYTIASATGDIQLGDLQNAILELNLEADFRAGLEKAIEEIRKVEP